MAIGFRFREQVRDKIIHRQADEKKELENEKRRRDLRKRRCERKEEDKKQQPVAARVKLPSVRADTCACVCMVRLVCEGDDGASKEDESARVSTRREDPTSCRESLGESSLLLSASVSRELPRRRLHRRPDDNDDGITWSVCHGNVRGKNFNGCSMITINSRESHRRTSVT